MEHGLELISPILEILDISISIFQSYPGNIGYLNFLISHILEILEISIFIFPHNIENLLKRRSGRAAGGRGRGRGSGVGGAIGGSVGRSPPAGGADGELIMLT